MEIIANKNFCFLDKAFMQSIDTFFIISLSLNNFYSQLFFILIIIHFDLALYSKVCPHRIGKAAWL